MSGYLTDPELLAACRAELVAGAAEGRRAVHQLRSRAADMLATGWQGRSASSFEQGWQRWLTGVEALLGALDELANTLGSAGAGYANTDDAVRLAMATGLHR